MVPLIVLIAMVLLPFFIILKRKANALLVFLAVCLGFVLATLIAADFADVITAMTQGNMLTTTQWIQAVLVAFTFIGAIILTKGGNTPGGPLVAIVLALIASVLAALLVISYLPMDMRDALQETVIWKELNNSTTALLITAGALALFGLRTKHSGDKHEKKGKHHH